MVDGQPFRLIRQFVRETCAWDCDDWTLHRYIERCTKSFAGESDPKRRAVKGRAVLRLERLYARAAQKGDLRVALSVLEATIRLHGLNAPEKHELTGAGGEPLGGATIEDYAARFDQLVRQQGERLRDAPRDQAGVAIAKSLGDTFGGEA